MEKIKARKMLDDFEAHIYSKRDAKSQRKRHRFYAEKGYPQNFKSRPLKTSEIELV